MDYFTFFAIIVLIGSSSSDWSTGNERTKAIRCYTEIMLHSDISNLLIDTTTPEAIDEFCRHHGDLLKCTRDNEHYMTVLEAAAYQKNVSGVNSFYVQLCPPGSDITIEYKENSACYQMIKNQILYCGSDLPDVNSYRMLHDRDFRCCSLERHRQCLKSVTEDKCGRKAADVTEKILLRYFDRQLKTCDVPSHGCDGFAPSTREAKATTGHRWYFHSTEREHHAEQGKKRTTEVEDKHWDHPTEASGWKKHKHNDAGIPTLSVIINLLSCVVALSLHKL